MILVVGIDAATWTIIRPNLDKLTTFRRLCQLGNCRKVIVKEKLVSPALWCGMFSGRTLSKHGHDNYVVGDNIITRQDIKVDFIWDILKRRGMDARAVNVPFVVPPYSFGVDFKPVGFGLPTNEKEWQEELEKVTETTMEVMSHKPDLLVSVYTLLDRVQHFHWGEDCVLEWYEKLDRKLGNILFDTGFLVDKSNRLIIISDHGFCSFGEAKIQTLPKVTTEGTLKGDHHQNALLITVNIDQNIKKPQDVFHVISALTA